MTGIGNANHVNPGKSNGDSRPAPGTLGCVASLSGPFDSAVSPVHVPCFSLQGPASLRTICALTLLFSAGKRRSLLSVWGQRVIGSHKDFFLERISSSVCFLIEKRDYVPSFHLTFTLCFSSVACARGTGTARQVGREALKSIVGVRAEEWLLGSCAAVSRTESLSKNSINLLR